MIDILAVKTPWGRGHSASAYAPAEGCDRALNLHCARLHESWKVGGVLARLDRGHREHDRQRKWRCYSLETLSYDAQRYVGGKQLATRHGEVTETLPTPHFFPPSSQQA